MRENNVNILDKENMADLGQSANIKEHEKSDEQLLQNFFTENRIEIEDRGFSEKVMRQLPDSRFVLLQRLWFMVCATIGVAFLVASQVWASLQDCLFASRIGFMLTMSKSLCHTAELLGHSHNLLMMLVGMITILCVWGYNKVLDARY